MSVSLYVWCGVSWGVACDVWECSRSGPISTLTLSCTPSSGPSEMTSGEITQFDQHGSRKTGTLLEEGSAEKVDSVVELKTLERERETGVWSVRSRTYVHCVLYVPSGILCYLSSTDRGVDNK